MSQVYIEAQAGFRKKNMSTVDSTFCSACTYHSYVKWWKTFYCALIDLTKAFNYVDRDILWYKLNKL